VRFCLPWAVLMVIVGKTAAGEADYQETGKIKYQKDKAHWGPPLTTNYPDPNDYLKSKDKCKAVATLSIAAKLSVDPRAVAIEELMKLQCGLCRVHRSERRRF